MDVEWTELSEWPEWVSEAFRVENASVLTCLVAILPAYRVPLRIEYLEPGAALGILEKYVLRTMLELQLERDEEIASILGMPRPEFVARVTRRFASSGMLYSENGRIRVLPALERALRSGRHLEKREILKDVFVDPLGVFADETGYKLRKSVQTADKLWLTTVLSGTLIGDLARSWVPGNGELVRAMPDEDQAKPYSRRVGVAVCSDNAGQHWFWGAFDFDSRQRLDSPMIAEVLTDAEIEKRALEALRRQEPDSADVAETEDIALSPSSASQKPDRESGTSGDYRSLIRSFGTVEGLKAWQDDTRKATREVLLFSPWIKNPAAETWWRVFDELLRRGVRIVVGWGIAANEEKDESHPNAVERMRGLASVSGRGWFQLVWVGRDHRKLGVVDQRVAYSGSLNVLSYAGRDRGSGVTVELVDRVEDKPNVVLKRDLLLSSFREPLLAAARRQGQFDSLEKWASCWCPLLGTLGDVDLIPEAVECGPKTVNGVVGCVERILDEAERLRSGIGADKARNVLDQVLKSKITGRTKDVSKALKRLHRRGLWTPDERKP
ncbi:MAG: hypothetical protein KF696_12525 [Planctomycetes bacterium]|nr:hypothetical protein [Planctomycetota bacterium]MCW8135914.1 hypothetical protein [Planctomycetota bacterium]